MPYPSLVICILLRSSTWTR